MIWIMNEQKIIEVNARCTRAIIRAIGMLAENQRKTHQGYSVSYFEKDFLNLIDNEGIGHNQVITELYNS